MNLDKEWFDASKLTEFRVCPQKYYWHYEQGMVAPAENTHLRFGSAIHKALELYYERKFDEHLPIADLEVSEQVSYLDEWTAATRRGSLRQGMHAFLSEFPPSFEQAAKTQLAGLQLLAAYTKKYPLETEGWKPLAVEQTMSIDMGQFYYIGKLDLIAQWPDGRIRPIDHKTTGQFGLAFDNSFKIDLGQTGYINMVRRTMDPKCNSGYINALRVTKNISVDESFCRRETTRTDWEIERWEAEVAWTVSLIHRCRESGYWPHHGHSCTDYNSLCPYYNICLSAPTERQKLASMNLREERWEPI